MALKRCDYDGEYIGKVNGLNVAPILNNNQIISFIVIHLCISGNHVGLSKKALQLAMQPSLFEDNIQSKSIMKPIFDETNYLIIVAGLKNINNFTCKFILRRPGYNTPSITPNSSILLKDCASTNAIIQKDLYETSEDDENDIELKDK